jgi:two-component system cell cycle sensor histidine kinase/response regulator CckA
MQMISGVVLVIDDEKPVLEAIREILEFQGLQVLQAENGRLGLALYKEHHQDVDLVILDWSMPEMNGAETFVALCEYDPDVRVILSSGYSEKVAATDFGKRQFVGFLQKPYNLSTLIEIVRQQFSSKLDDL